MVVQQIAVCYIVTVCTSAKDLNLDFVQLHGTEDEAYVNGIHKPVIKAFNIGAKNSSKELKEKVVNKILI